MASIDTSSFLPPLDKCFNGEAQVWSWQDISTGLTSSKSSFNNPKLTAILKDPLTRRYLLDPFTPTRHSSNEDKALFNSLTATSKAVPTKTDTYDLSVLKEDALWLSQKAGIDEIFALKLVVLDWMRQPTKRLLANFSEEELLAIQDVVSSGSSAEWPLLESENDEHEDRSTSARRHDLLLSYTVEMTHLVEVIFNIHLLGLYQDTNFACQSVLGNLLTGLDSHLLSLFLDIFQTSRVNGVSDQTQSLFLQSCTNAIRTRLVDYAREEAWAEDVDNSLELDEAWRHLQLVQAAYLARHFFVNSIFMTMLPSIPAVQAWFGLMKDYGFFHERMNTSSSPACSAVFSQLGLLASITSFTLLQIKEIRMIVVERPRTAANFRLAEQDTECPYIFDAECVRTVNSALVEAAKLDQAPARFAMYAWSLVGVTIKDVVAAQKEELAWRLMSVDPNTPYPDDTKWDIFHGILTDKDVVYDLVDGDQVEILARISIVTFQTLEMLAQISSKLSSVFPSFLAGPINSAIRISFLSLLHQSLQVLDYSAELIQAIVSLLNAERTIWTYLDSEDHQPDVVGQVFYSDAHGFVHSILNQAFFRFPLELTPLLELVSALGMGIHSSEEEYFPMVDRLSEMRSFTQRLSREFNGYEIHRTNNNGYEMHLIRPIWLFSSRSNWGRGDYDHDGCMEIQEGTSGTLITSSPPHVTSWNHTYNAFQFLTSCLDTITSSCDFRLIMTPEGLDLDSAADIVSSITTLLASCIRWTDATKTKRDVAEAAKVLEQCTSLFPRERPLATIIFEILEQQLELEYIQDGSDSSLNLIVKCVEFVYILTLVAPYKVWTPLSRSRLLDLDGSGSALAAIVTSREMVSGTYDLLQSCIRLYDALIEDAVVSSVRRKVLNVKAVTRFNRTSDADSATPDRIITAILYAFTKVLSGVFETFPSWRYLNLADRLEIGTRLMEIFRRLFGYAYSIDDQASAEKRIVSVLQSSVNYLVDSLLSETPDSLLSKSLLSIIVSSIPSLTLEMADPDSSLWRRQTTAALSFSEALLRVRMYLNRSTSWLEAQLFRISPVFVRIFASSSYYHVGVAALLQAMVESAAKGKDEPTSLIGHMGQTTVKDFLAVLMRIDSFTDREHIEHAVWRLFCAVVRTRQRSFALALVTGLVPRARNRALKGERAASQSLVKKSVFTVALEKLTELERLPLPLSLVLVQFVASAMNFWQMAIVEYSKNTKCQEALYRFLATVPSLRSSQSQVELPVSLEMSKRRSVAAGIAEIMAMHFHHSRQLGDKASLESIASKAKLFQDGSKAPPYNHSLLANLSKNFNNKFNPFEVQQFRRTGFAQPEAGSSFYFDVEFASKLLRFDVSWEGARSRPQSGMRYEFELANANLSWVDSQLRLMTGVGLLAMELSYTVGVVAEAAGYLQLVLTHCLEASRMTMGPQPKLMESVVMENLRLAFSILQRFSSYERHGKAVKDRFVDLWDGLASSGIDFESLYGVEPERLEYYRIMLRMLFLTVQAHAGGQEASLGASLRHPVDEQRQRESELYLEILDKVVLQGFKSFVSELHNQTGATDPSDLVLITGILQALLQIPAVQRSHSQILLLVSQSETVRYAVSLFSWSDRLTDSDPVYAELSILFILALSTIPLVAESMAVDGILAQLSSCNLVKCFRSARGIGPFERPWRIYSVWAHGILPLCLNLLDTVGPSLGADVSNFLNQFPGQLARNADTLASIRSSIVKSQTPDLTLGIACETHALALVALLIDSYRAGGAALGVIAADVPVLDWDRSGMVDDIKTWLRSSKLRRERIAAVTERDAALLKAPPSAKVEAGPSGAGDLGPLVLENQLEEQVVMELRGALLCLEQKVEF